MSFSWQGASGRWYEFNVARAKRAWDPVAGIYMFVKPGDYPTMEAGGPICLYLGVTDNFTETLARHDYWSAAQQLGAGEIHLVAISDPAQREKAARDLLDAHTPILNKQMLRRVA